MDTSAFSEAIRRASIPSIDELKANAYKAMNGSGSHGSRAGSETGSRGCENVEDEEDVSPPLSFYANIAQESRRPWSPQSESIVMEPYTYLDSHPGKDIRSLLMSAFNIWLQVPTPALSIITSVVGMLHTSSLLIDDVEDNATLRRGVPVAHAIYGVAQTVNTANYVYFRALEELGKLNNPSLLTIFTEELLNLHRGQGMDLFWRDTLTCPSEPEYVSMVANKTGGLLRLAVKLMQASSPINTTDYVPLVNTIGILFQIRDDYLNLQSPLMTANKGYCEDLTEGKFSFPIIHAVRADRGNRQILNILKQRTGDVEVKAYAVKYMREETKSFEYTLGVLDVLFKSAREEVRVKGGNKALEAIIDRLEVNEETQ
ncbi:geranylgeranyl pyrophosphate synthetase [Saitoella coloradoensis]